MGLSIFQRIKRRVSLLGGSYTHPDGTIEFDFEASAGVKPGDSEAIRDLKLAQYHAKQRVLIRLGGALMLGVVIYLIADRAGFSTSDAFSLALLAGVGVFYAGRS